jgi:hypothetical protein
MDIEVHHFAQIGSISKPEFRPFAVLGDLTQFQEVRQRLNETQHSRRA